MAVEQQFITRDFKEDDMPEVLGLWELTGMASSARADNLEVIRRTLAAGGRLLVMQSAMSKKIIGTSWITNDGRRLYLHHFAISPGLQGHGLGRLLLGKTLEFARESNLQIKLEVHRDNLRAVQLYEKNGFSYLGDYKVYIIRDYSKI